jgi:ribosomal protein L6P/L9E
VDVPLGLNILLFKSNLLSIQAFDYQYLNEFCSVLRFYKKLDSYKGKGICFRHEFKFLKEGKKAQQ